MDDPAVQSKQPVQDDTAPIPVNDKDETTQKAALTPDKQTTVQSQFAGVSPLQAFTDRALNFLSHASNETLGACLVGLGASTYLVLGRVGLLIIGVAGGVVLHATWEGIRGDDRDDATKEAENTRKREAGIDVVRRALDWRTTANAGEKTEDIRIHASQALDYSSFGPEAAAALDAFTTAVINDYVYYWYGPTLPGEDSFPASCRQTFTAFVLSLSGHLQRKRPADAFLDFVTNASSIIIVFLNELASAVNASPNASVQEAISAYLKLKPDSSLAYMLDQESQKLKLADASEDILQAYLDSKSYNCPPVHTFLKEILAQLVLGYTVTKCSEPTWINEWIVYGLEESATAKEVMDIVDAGVEGRDKIEAPRVEQQINEAQHVKSRKENAQADTKDASAHRRKMSRAEEAMDEAMREAKRLTDMMIAEDERKAREEAGAKGDATPPSTAGDSSDGATQGAPTPTSSQSDRDRRSEETTSVSDIPDNANGKSSHASTPSAQFTSFDQIVPNTHPTALTDSPTSEKPAQKPSAPVLTLHNANISIFDDSVPGERASIKAKPNTDYLIQIEPASSAFPGWMIARKYQDFEMLHEVLRRISVITGGTFTEGHAELPKWKSHTKASLRAELERYLTDAVKTQNLAESEGMKRFLEKDRGLSKSPSGNKGFGWPTPDAFGKFGGDMMNVLTKAPKQVAGGVAGGGKAVFGGVAEGGKAVFGGVTGLVGAVGNVGKKANTSQHNLSRSTTSASLDENDAQRSRSSMQLPAQPFMTDTYLGSMDVARESHESFRTSPRPTSDSRRSSLSGKLPDSKPLPGASSSKPASIMSNSGSIRAPTVSPSASTAELPSESSLAGSINLPPPPSEMPADYASPTSLSRSRKSTLSSAADAQRGSQITDPSIIKPKTEPKKKAPLSERETSVAIELMFAVISELYTLSGAWQIRKTLLTAAKTYLLRPGNPQLAIIKDLLQASLLDANLSDEGLAHQVKKLRENTLPTTEELEIWARDYPEKSEEQKEELRMKARTLLVTKGMPQALTSVMGAAASGVAMGKIFDCLQIPEVSRGLVFGLMLQALRVITH